MKQSKIVEKFRQMCPEGAGEIAAARILILTRHSA